MYTKHRRVFRQCWNNFEFRIRKDSIMSVESCGSPQKRRLPRKQEHVSCHVLPLVLYFILFSFVRRQHLVALALSKPFRARSLANYRIKLLLSHYGVICLETIMIGVKLWGWKVRCKRVNYFEVNFSRKSNDKKYNKI